MLQILSSVVGKRQRKHYVLHSVSKGRKSTEPFQFDQELVPEVNLGPSKTFNVRKLSPSPDQGLFFPYL